MWCWLALSLAAFWLEGSPGLFTSLRAAGGDLVFFATALAQAIVSVCRGEAITP